MWWLKHADGGQKKNLQIYGKQVFFHFALHVQCVWKRNAIHWIRALAAVLQFVSATLVVGFCGTSSLVTSSTDMPSSYSPVDPPLHDTVMYRYLTGKRVSKAIEGGDFVLISKRLWERKSRKFSSAGADTNPQNPRISDNLEGKPLGFLITQLGQNILFFSYLIWSEVLRFLKCSLRYCRKSKTQYPLSWFAAEFAV